MIRDLMSSIAAQYKDQIIRKTCVQIEISDMKECTFTSAVYRL